MTKPLHEDPLKCPLDVKLEVLPESIDNSLVICGGHGGVAAKPNAKLKVRMVKSKVNATRKTRLGRVTQQLYDLESGCEPEKVLNIDLGLYQMEDY